LEQERFELAEKAFNEMLSFIPEGGQDLIALAQYGLARVAAAKGQLNQALSLARASAKVLELVGYRYAKEVRNWLRSICQD
ncbi:hypothetical protein, partial [Thermogemmatispora sp.]